MDSKEKLIQIISNLLEEVRDMKSEIKGFRQDTNSRLEKPENTTVELVRKVVNLDSAKVKII